MNTETVARHLSTVAFLASFALAGCTSVTTTEPVGYEKAGIIKQELKETWIFSNNQTYLVHGDTSGNIILAETRWDETENRFTLSHGKGVVLQINDMPIVNIRREGEEAYHFFVAIFDPEKDAVCLFFPDSARIKKLINNGVLEGNPDQSDNECRLTGKGDDISRYIRENGFAGFFTWKHPIVLKRFPFAKENACGGHACETP